MYYHTFILVTLFIVAPIFTMYPPMNLSDQEYSSDSQAEFADDEDNGLEIMSFTDDKDDEIEITQAEQTYLARQMMLIKQIIQERESRIQDMIEQTKAMIIELNRQEKYNTQDEQEIEQNCCCSLF